MMKQPVVNGNLGKNVTNKHEETYKCVEEKQGPTYRCRGIGVKKGYVEILGIKCPPIVHDQDVPIRDFHLQRESKNGLQNKCKDCDKRKRRLRLDCSREANKGRYDTYVKNYGKNTYVCSFCNEEKDVRENFGLSPSMECGIHNILYYLTSGF